MSRPSVDGQKAQRPAGYPLEFERQVTLQDGRIVDVRPVVPDDAAELREAIKTADADTVSRRFLGGGAVGVDLEVDRRLLDGVAVAA